MPYRTAKPARVTCLAILTLVVFGTALSGTAAGAPVRATGTLLRPGVAVDGDVTPGRARVYLLRLAKGQFVHVTLEPFDAGIVAAILDPSGSVLLEIQDPDGGDAPLSLSAIAVRSGVFQIKLAMAGRDTQSVRCRLVVDPPRQATDDDRLHVQGAQAYADGVRLTAQEKAESSRDARKRFEAAREIAHRRGDARDEAAALMGIGGVQFVLGATREALATVQDALVLYRTAGDRRGEAETLGNLGVATSQLGEYKGALEYYDRALPIAHELGLVRLEARTLSNIGTAHQSLGDARTALAFWERSLPLRRQAGDIVGESTTLANMGVAYRMLGDRGRALAAYEHALLLARAGKNAAAQIGALENLGALSLAVGDRARGEEVLGQALALSRRTGDRRDEGFVLGWLSHAERLKGNYAQAIALARQEIALQRAVDNRLGEGSALTYLGSLQRLVGEPAAAEQSVSDALRIHRETGNRAGETYALLQLAGIRQDAGNLAEAATIYTQALEMSRSLSDPGATTTALFRTAQLQRAMGNLEDARRSVEAAIPLLETARTRVSGAAWRAAFFVSAQETYEFLIDLLMTMDAARPGEGLARQAFDASERKRARSLLDLLTDAGVPAASPADPASIESAQRLLDDRTTLLEFSLGERASYAWAITRTDVHAVRLAPRTEIDAAAHAFHDRLASPPPSDAAARDRHTRLSEAAGSELTRLLLDPLADHLRLDRIAIVADGGLQYVPFAALPEPRSQRTDGDASAIAPLLVDGHEVVCLPSIAALERLRENAPARSVARRTVAVLADPVFEADDPRVRPSANATRTTGPAVSQPRADLLRAARDVRLDSVRSAFPRLPYSRQEAEAIVSAAAPGSVLRALDFDASRTTALSSRLASYGIVHFATHGFLDDARPDLSGLVLSLVDRAGRPQDGFLRVRDIDALRLPVDLVVLSGCRTALGTELRGEGLLGIVRAFMHAGAPRIVASVWDVDDRATAVFMKAFYGAILTSGRSPAAALREAQLALRAQARWRDPYYWAAFVVQGEWN